LKPFPNPRPFANEDPNAPWPPNDEPTCAFSGPPNLVPETTDELTPNRPEDPNDDLLDAVILVERVADVAVPLWLVAATAGRAPPDGAPEFRENVEDGAAARFPADAAPVPRLPVAPVLPELRAAMDEPERPGAAPKRALEGGVAALPPYMPFGREP